MSSIEEQYQAAARQRREHDAARPNTAEYIRTTPTWKCICGNEPELQGFHELPDYGPPWPAGTSHAGEPRWWACDRCKRVIVAPHGYVMRGPQETRTRTDGVRCQRCGHQCAQSGCLCCGGDPMADGDILCIHCDADDDGEDEGGGGTCDEG